MAAAAPEFERVVRDAMDAKDLSLVALARASGIDRGRWYAWFRGENAPQPRTLTRAATVLGLGVDQLLAPWGGSTRPGPVVTADPGLAPLTAAINRLAAALEGRPEATAAIVEAAIAEDQRQAAEASETPSGTPETLPHARQGE